MSMKEYLMKFKSIKHSLLPVGYAMTDKRVIEYVLKGLDSYYLILKTFLNMREVFPNFA